MIAAEQSKIIRDLFGKRHYAIKIAAYLKREKIFNKFGNPYSRQFVSHVVTGRTHSEIVEKAIWNCVEEYTAQREAEKERQEELIKNAKKLTDD